MTLPANTNPKFLAWYNSQAPAVKTAIDEYWDQTATDERLFPGHKSEEYARLTFLIDHCAEEYGYNA
jgi:hypothetical protein